MANVLVTGGAGFIGSHVVDELVKMSHRVVVLDDLSGGFEKNINIHAKFVKGSITDAEIVERVIKENEIEYIYHLAAYAAEGLSHFIRKFNYENNLIGSMNLINSAIRNNIKCFVFASSMAVYGTARTPMSEDLAPQPEDPYGISKFAVEMDLKIAHELFGLNYVIFRPHNVYGERQYMGDPYRNVIGIFMNRIMQNKEIIIFGDGRQTRAFSYIGDVAPCIAKSAFIEGAYGETINIGAGKEYSINQLADEVKFAMKSNSNTIYVPPRYEVKHAYCTTKKSKWILGFKETVDLREGIKKMAEWAKKEGPQKSNVWESYEVYNNIPQIWLDLQNEKEKNPN